LTWKVPTLITPYHTTELKTSEQAKNYNSLLLWWRARMQCAWLVVVVVVAAVSGQLLSLAPAVSECNTPWTDCGSTHVKINNVHVKNCCASPCKLVLGQNTTISFTFTPGMHAYTGIV
ncbi:hypothetical protein GBAR_LOCUS18227, partial [Geodia barretti]